MKATIIAAIIIVAALLASIASADEQRRERRRESRNYIIERQQAGAVTGTPTSRRIIGKREIDVYRNGLMFEGNNVIGIEPRR